jgi:hypothetical protein
MIGSATDLSFEANLERMDQFLLLGLLGAMVFAGLCYTRGRREWWPRVFGISSVGALLVQGGLLVAAAVQEGLRNSDPPSGTPDLPVSFETWILLGSIGSLVLGLALLGAGVSLIYLGWLAGKKPVRSAKKSAREGDQQTDGSSLK